MDRGRTVLSAALAASVAASGAASAQLDAIAEARWLAPGADIAAALGPEPAECLPDDDRQDPAIRTGRAAFRTPLLLGGHAARAGLSCHSCHRGGADHPDFHFEGLSGSPGTADVTSSLFSKVRGDGVFNPVPIPSLVGGAGAPQVSRDAASGALEAFISAQIVEEFDGPTPPNAVIAGLAAYVRALDREACPSEGDQRDRLEHRLADISAAVTAAGQSLANDDAEIATLMIASARTELGRIHARVPGATLSELRDALIRADAELRTIRDTARTDALTARDELRAWSDRFSATAQSVREQRAESLFDPVRLRAAIAAETD